MTDLSIYGVPDTDTVAFIYSRTEYLDFIHGDYRLVYELYIPSLGISIDRNDKQVNAFLNDGHVYDTSIRWHEDRGPRLRETLWLGTRALAMFVRLKESLVSLEQAKQRVAELFL